ncbi:GGDEF domain-containing protein [Arthrobacter sp. CAU 1506]|uniref:GGDEF domain-containing protein n=1 Tax=Arthrobacter sp. CAU 1506 TaxID=2560052 RepID=UPI0010AC97B0|nr:GGDEF domain-containing protein [Arthrobacter sp. CAU 1506]TJY64117.1 GGDEF domain-containing protein [Arthrobacter sp. CAU 1506]
MQLDTVTLRVAFGAMSLALLLLFYLVTFRRTRAAYSAWWCAALVLFLFSATAYLLNGTAVQWWANPLGNVFGVAGAWSVWTAARSLRSLKPMPWLLVPALAVAAGTAAVDHPAINVWAGGPAFLGCMALFLGLSSAELFLLRRASPRLRTSLALTSAFMGFFYLCRLVAFLADGPDGAFFQRVFGSGPTTLVTMTLLMVVSFSMAAFSAEQAAVDLRKRALHDGLTGLLNRSAFLELAAARMQALQRAGASGTLVLADLDHFKQINDANGHAAGDTALRAFAAACTGTVRSTDLVGRYGGEEFILLLPGADAEQAEDLTHLISTVLRQTASPDLVLPTVSYGIAPIGERGADALADIIAAADEALYQAKSQGRDRAVLAVEHGNPDGLMPGAKV